jgi:ABC-type multidrug transport system ATPase subunit
MTSPTLEVSELNAGYGDVAVLRDVTMQVRSGSVVALLGPNGAGKTTLLRVISGLLRPTQGRVLLGMSLICEPNNSLNSGCVTFRRAEASFPRYQ